VATFTYPTPTASYTGGQPAVGRDVRDDLDEIRTFVVGKNLEGSNIVDDSIEEPQLDVLVREQLNFTGVIQMWVLNTEPSGWLICDGQVVLKATYPDLHLLITDTYGPETATTFTLPDFRAQMPIGLNDASTPNGVDGARTARALADASGTETQTLTEANLKDHVHGIGSHTHKMFTDETESGTPTSLRTSDGNVTAEFVQLPQEQSYQMIKALSLSPTLGNTSTAGTDTDSTGSGDPFGIVNPLLTVNFIIKT